MNIKEQENQLNLNLILEIFLTVIVWLSVCSFVGYQLWRLYTTKETPITISMSVPTIKQANLDVLRSSIKAVSSSNLPVVRMEPFD